MSENSERFVSTLYQFLTEAGPKIQSLQAAHLSLGEARTLLGLMEDIKLLQRQMDTLVDKDKSSSDELMKALRE